MPPKTLTAEQVAEIDRQQKPAVNMRDVVPQREDVLAARITAQERREAAPATLTPEQVDTTEAQTSVAAMTPFGRAMGAEPDRASGPVFQPKKRLSATEVDQMQYEQISDPAYIPTKEEFQWYEGYKKTRDEKVSKFVQGAKGMAGGLVQAAAATAYAPFDILVRGTPAWNEWVNSSAEGLRQTSIGVAELWSWGGDIYEDNQKELQRSRDLNNQIRQQLAAENKFAGNGQQDEQTLQQAIEQAKAGGLYEKTANDLNADDDTRYERFIRDRSFQQQAANITETNIGTLPDSQREMGIDPSKVNPGLAFTAQLVYDPLNAVVPGGIGALSNLRLMRRAAALTGAPLKLSAQVAKAGADKVEDIYGGILSGIESRTGLNEAAAMGALNNPVTWRAVAAMGILKGTGKVLRKSENLLETGSIIAKEAGVGGVGISRADAAARLRNAPIPERYRRAYDGFFTSADSTLRRVSETPGLSPIARRSAATLDRTGVTQAFRLADDAVSGAAAAAPIGIPFAAIAPEDRQPEILGAILSIGAAGGVVGGQARRMSEMNDALVAKMLADAEISGGDAVAMANMLSPEKLSDMARKQTMISAKADWVPLRAVDYELDKTVKAAVGNGTKGIHVEASPGKRPRVFLNLDKLASGDVAGHEIGHAIFMSDIMGGEIKQGMRAMVDVEYGAEGLAARGREYAAAMLTQEVNQGATGIKLEVLTPEEVSRKAAGVSDADLIRDRWSNDTAWRDSAINDRIDLMNQERMARSGQPLDWARDEIAAETFSGLGKGVNLSGLRASGPLGRAVGAAQTALDMMGARFRGNGRLESPNRLFTENPLFDSPQMRKAVNDYVKIYDRYLVGLEKEGKVQQRGTPIAPTGRASDAARSPHTRLYANKGVVESDLFVQRPDGTLELKSQQMVNTQDKARAATLKSINSRDRLVPENSQEWGARRLSNGRVVVGGPTLPPQFDFFLQMPEWLRFKAREFEGGRNEGRSYLYSYNAIGTGADGSYKVKNLGNVEAKTGEAVPFGWDLSQKNHLLAKVIDLNSFRASSMRAIDNQLLGEFGNDLKAVEAGLKQLLKNYQDGVPGETNLGVTKKNILNGLLGTGTPTQRANNPAWHTLNNQGSIRTFRFDRLNYADPYGAGYFPHYDKLNINALPDNAGRMSVDDYMGFNADRKAAYLNNRARERGFTNSTNWENTDAAGFAAATEEYGRLFPQPDNNRMPQAIPRRAQGMPDVAVVPERFTGTGQEPNRQSRFAQPPPFFARFPIESYERGGKFFDAQNGDDLTGRSYGAGFIDVSSGKPRLFVDGDPAAQPAKSGRTYRTNLFKQKAGWKWISDNAPATSTIVSVEGGGRHIYSLRADFEGGVDLARYSDKPSEPRLRPTARGELSLGNEVGRISIRGKEHPVYDGARIAQPSAPRGQGMPDVPVVKSQAMPDTNDMSAYHESLLDDVESWSNARDTGKIDYEMQDVVDSFVDFARANPQMVGGELTAAFYRAESPTASQRKKLSAAIANVGEPPRVATGAARGQAMPDVGDVSSGLPRRSMQSRGKTQIADDGTITYKGKEPADWTPEEFAAFGKEFGVGNLGPLSKVTRVVDDVGRDIASIPGGLDGKFTYYDLLWLKANPVDVASLPVGLHGKLTAKLARTMTPEVGNRVQKFNGIVFGFLSANAPLLPNEMGQARLRFGSMKEIADFGNLLPDNPTAKQMADVNTKLKKELGFSAAEAGGMGIGLSQDLSNVVVAAKLFTKNPDFFIKRADESWGAFVDKVSTQLRGLGTKTASFGSVWQDPLMAAISAMDRHMSRVFSKELLTNPTMKQRFEGIVVKRFNSGLESAKKVAKSYEGKIKRAKNDEARAELIAEQDSELAKLPDPRAAKAKTIDDVLAQAERFGQQRVQDFINEAAFSAMGTRKGKYMTAKGGVNPNVPESLQGVQWVETPRDFQVMSDAYRAALELNEARAKDIGVEVFPAQWTLWDRIRQRVEPHEAMFPGLEKLPAINDRQLGKAFEANKAAGYMTTPEQGKTWRRQSGISPASLAYFTPAVLAAGAAATAMEEQ